MLIESAQTEAPSPKDGTHMAINLTDLQLSTLDSLITPIDPNDDWIVTDGGSAIRSDVEGMNEELADAPIEDRSAQTLEALRAHQSNAIAARSK
jgi:hypothetical protein